MIFLHNMPFLVILKQKMAKDPSFLFYTNDFYTGTVFMSNEEVGMYIRLLCLQHQTGHMSKEDMLNICNKGYVGNTLVIPPKKVFSKFIQDVQGLYYNERLEEEIIKRIKYCENQRDNVNKRWKKDVYDGITKVIPLEDEDEDGIKKEVQEGEKNGYITPKLFETFWKLYPKKIDKGKALSSWNKICTRKNITPPLWKELRIALHHQKQSERWKDKTFIPHPTTWLNQSRWLDDPLEMKNFGDRDKENFKCLFGGKFGEGFNPSVERCRNCEEDESKLYRRCRLEFSQLKQLKA